MFAARGVDEQASHGLEVGGRRAGREGGDERLLAAGGHADVRVIGQIAQMMEIQFEELPGRGADGACGGYRLRFVPGHIHEQVNVGVYFPSGNDLGHGVSVRDRGRLGCGDQDDLRSSGEEMHHIFGHPGGGIDDGDVRFAVEGAQLTEEELEFVLGDVGHLLDARAGRDDAHPAGMLQNHVTESFVPEEDMIQVELRLDAQHDINVREAEVRIDQEYPLAIASQDNGEIGGGACLADSTFAAGNGNDSASCRAERTVRGRPL